MAEMSTLGLDNCRCCKKLLTDKKHSINVLREKATAERICQSINEYGLLNVKREDDGILSTTICQSCYTTVKSIKEKIERFREICKTPFSPPPTPPKTPPTKEKRSNENRSPCQSAFSPTSKPSLKRAKLSLFGKIQPRQIAPKKESTIQPDANQDAANNPAPGPESTDTKEIAKSEKINAILNEAGLRNKKLQEQAYTPIEKGEIKNLHEAINTSIPSEVCKAVMALPSLKNCIKFNLLEEMDIQCQRLCIRKSTEKNDPSKLYVSSKELKTCLEGFEWNDIMQEMKEKAPDVLDVLATISTPVIKKGRDQVPPICMTYGILMHERWRELSLIQKVMTIILGIGHSTSKTFERCAAVGLTQSRKSYRNMLDGLGDGLIDNVKRMIQDGHELRLAFDNFDFKILTNIIVKGYQNSDMHWMSQYITFDRVSSANIDDTKPIVADIKQFDNTNYLLSTTELEEMRDDYIVLVCRILVEYFRCLWPIKSVIPTHITHQYSKEMANPSTIINMPVVPYNQNNVGDVCQYLQYLTHTLADVFKPQEFPVLPVNASSDDVSRSESEVLKKQRIPLVGDLLGRERVTGAKKLRAGCDNPTDQFKHIVEVPAVWHAKQSFLCYIWEQLFNTSSARDIGTLYHLRLKSGKKNVSSNVKKNYKASAEFMDEVTKSYLCEAFMEWAGLDSLEGTPTKIKVPALCCSRERKIEFVHTVIGKFVDEYVLPEFDIEKEWRQQKEQRAEQRQMQTQETSQEPSPVSNTEETSKEVQRTSVVAYIHPNNNFSQGDAVILLRENRVSVAVGTISQEMQTECTTNSDVSIKVVYVFPCTIGIYKQGEIISWPRHLVAKPVKVLLNPSTLQGNPTPSLPSPVSDLPPKLNDKNDGVFNYGLQVLQLGIFKMQLDDTEQEGDGERMMRNWKMLMLFSRSRRRGGKYAYEAMRLITYCRALHTKKMAHRIIHGQFVNPRGGEGKNYANDLKQEHLVKCNKVVLQGLCGNKTLKAVTRVTKSAYSQKLITDNYDDQSHITKESSSHTYGDCKEDVREMVTVLHGLKPFHYTPGRKHDAHPTLSKSPLDQLDPVLLDKWLTRHKKRLASNSLHNYDEEDVESDEDENEDDCEEELLLLDDDNDE